VSAELQVPFEAIFHEQDSQSIPLLSGLPGAQHGVGSHSGTSLAGVINRPLPFPSCIRVKCVGTLFFCPRFWMGQKQASGSTAAWEGEERGDGEHRPWFPKETSPETG